MPRNVWTQTLGPTVLDIVLETDVRRPVQHMAGGEFLVDPHAAMALRVSTVNWPRIVWLDNPLIGAGDIASRRIEAVRQIVEGKAVAPVVRRIGRIAESVRNPASPRDASGHLVSNVPVAVRVSEIEHRDGPIAQRRPERGPIPRARDRDHRPHIVDVFRPNPTQRQRRIARSRDRGDQFIYNGTANGRAYDNR